MKIYIAAKYQMKNRFRKYAELLEENGHAITSSWLYRPDVTTMYEGKMAEYASNDLIGIQMADLVVVMDTGTETGGYWVELGYALAMGKPIIVFTGHPRNVFLELTGDRFKVIPESWEPGSNTIQEIIKEVEKFKVYCELQRKI